MESGQNSVTLVSFTSIMKAQISAGQSEGFQSCFELNGGEVKIRTAFPLSLAFLLKGKRGAGSIFLLSWSGMC